MKCINNFVLKCMKSMAITLVMALLLAGCGKEYTYPYKDNAKSGNFQIAAKGMNNDVFDSFASDLCIASSDDYTEGALVDGDRFYSGGLFDLKNQSVLYAKNVHTRLNPASLTKIMTALVAFQYSNLDDIITCSKNVEITESGAQLVGLKEGDHLTMNQALHCLLMFSANDAAVAIAEHVAGSVEAFADLMNEEAKALGATNCHFVNPHGLTDENHYVTAYDLYLVFHEAMKYDEFVSIIQMPYYDSVYRDVEGKEKTMSFSSTNQFLKDAYHAPDGITVIGGKTGTTNAARNCLILLCKDVSGNPYIAIILGDEERGTLYDDMILLLTQITK